MVEMNKLVVNKKKEKEKSKQKKKWSSPISSSNYFSAHSSPFSPPSLT